MTMERFMFKGFYDEAVYDDLRRSNTFPLVRDLEFTYGLKVLKKSKRGGWVMCYRNGFTAGEAIYGDDPETDKPTFRYFSPLYSKARASGWEDKHTIRSQKQSSLMGALKRNSVVTVSLNKIQQDIQSTLHDLVNLQSGAIGRSSYTPNLSADEAHALVARYLDVKVDRKNVAISAARCQDILDKLTEVNRISDLKLVESRRAFMNPFYLVAAYPNNEFVLGKLKCTNVDVRPTPEILQDFCRYKDVQSTGDGSFIAAATMLKVANEDKPSKIAGFTVVQDKYDLDLDVGYCYRAQPTDYEPCWTMIPCST